MSNAGKKGQRTKGNVKPSSSSKAAELLSASGFGVSSTVGFLGFSSAEEEYEELEPDFRIAFRKLVKKESTTKIKALKELSELIENSDEKVVLVAWQCWPRLYSKVSLDADFKVREESHYVLDAFFRKLGRQIATQLKLIMPFWILGEHDPYPLASLAAKSAFQKAFPDVNKRCQALNFCKDAVVAEYADILYGERSYKSDVSSTKNADAETDAPALEMKINRLSSSVLQSLTTVLTELNDDDRLPLKETVKERYLNKPKFWNVVGKNKNSAVKSSWFKFLCVVIEKFSELSREFAAQISPAVVNNLDRQTPEVCRSAWDALLLCLDKFPQEFWANVNFQKAFFPKLSSILRKGGDGLASAVCTALLPVVGKFSSSSVQDLNAYYIKLMANFEHGIRICNEAKFDAVERICFLNAYVDCLKFVVVTLIEEKEILKQLLLDQCFSALTLCVSTTATSKQKETSTIFADFISFVVKMREKRDDEETFEKFLAAVSDWFKTTARDSTNVDGVRNLLCSTSKRTNCRKLVADLCGYFWSSYVNDGTVRYLRLFCDVLRDFADDATKFAFVNLIDEKFNLETCADVIFEKDSSLDLDLDESFLLLMCVFSFPIVDCSSLKRFFGLKSTTLRYALLVRLVDVLNNQRTSPAIVDEIVRTNEFRDLFLICFADMTNKIANGESSFYDWHVFVSILCSKRDDKILLPNFVDAILDDLLRLVRTKNVDRSVLHRCVELVSRISSTLFNSSQDIATSVLGRDLTLALFDLYSADVLPNDFLENLRTSWTLALNANVTSSGGLASENSLVARMCRRLIDRLLSEQSLTETGLNRLVDVAKELFLRYDELISSVAEESSSSSAASILLPFLLPCENHWTKLVDGISSNNFWKLNAQFQNSFPIFDLVDEESLKNVSKTSLDRLIRICSYSLRFYRVLTTETNSNVSSQNFYAYFDDSVCASVVLITYLANWREFLNCTSNADDDWHSLFRQQLKSSAALIDEFSRLENERKTNYRSIFERCFYLSSNFGGLWTLALLYLPSNEEKITTSTAELRCVLGIANVDFDEFSKDLDEKCLEKLTKSFLYASKTRSVVVLLEILSLLVSNQEKLENLFLFNQDISNVSNDALHFNVAVVRFLLSLVENLPEMSNESQDFVFCSLLAWLESCVETKRFNVANLTFSVVVCQLFNKIAAFVENLTFGNEKPPSYVDDWKDFFLNGCQAIFVPYFYKLCEKNSPKLNGYVLREVATALTRLNGEKLLNYDLPLLLSPDLDGRKYPEKLQSVLLNFSPLLLVENRAVQIGSYNILNKIVGELNKYELIDDSDAKSDEQICELPSYFLNPLKSSYEKLHEISSEFDEDDDETSTINKNEILYSNVLAYLLTWKLVLQFFDAVKTDRRPTYSTYLRNSGLLGEFLSIIFTLISEESGFYCEETQQNEKNLNLNHLVKILLCKNENFVSAVDKTRYFTRGPSLDAKSFGSVAELRHLSCNVYFEALCTFPAVIRQWFNSLDRKTKPVVERFTSKYISPILCSYELETISKGPKAYDKMILTTRPKANQVVASYTVEDLNMELIVTLPAKYPLAQVSVEAPERLAVSNDKWRSWMFQLITCQNGSLLDGLLLWKRCVDKHLEGVEDCMICMMSVHGSSYKLPKVTCRQCKKKFHGECLRKWFETSNNANCPLCRTEFVN